MLAAVAAAIVHVDERELEMALILVQTPPPVY